MINCQKCRLDASNFTIRLSTFWKDVDVVCRCGHIVDSIYCTHCLEGGKKRYNEFRSACKNEIVYNIIDYGG